MPTSENDTVPEPGGRAQTTKDRSVTVWRRWPSQESVRFHRYCALFPYRLVHDGRSLGFEPTTEQSDGDYPRIRYTRGLTRAALRYTPLLIGLAIVFYLIRAQTSDDVVGIGAYLGSVGVSSSVGILFGLLLWLFLLGVLLWAVGILPSLEVMKAVVIYGELLVLISGLLTAIYLVATDPSWGIGTALNGVGPTGHVVFASGFLLMLFLGGQLVYDGMLKTENMFSNLHKKRETIIDNPAGYEQFLERFEAKLDHRLYSDRGPEWLPEQLQSPRTVYVFAVVFVTPFAMSGMAYWLESTGQTLLGIATDPIAFTAALIPFVLDVFLVVVFFQFLILIKFFNDLLTKHGPREKTGFQEQDGKTNVATDGGSSSGEPDFTLEYKPFHPDGYAGFKDIGRFATRVNTLLVVGGLYVVQRVYVHGTRFFPVDATGSFSTGMINWVVGFLGPVLFYVIAVVVWMYFSFWQIHQTMRRGKEIKLSELAEEIPDERDRDLEVQRNGPVWPVNGRFFVTILSMDVLPLIGLLPAIPT